MDGCLLFLGLDRRGISEAEAMAWWEKWFCQDIGRGLRVSS